MKPSVSSKSEGMCDPPEKRDNDGGAVINKVTVMSYSYCLSFWLVRRRLRVAASMEINGSSPVKHEPIADGPYSIRRRSPPPRVTPGL